MRKIVKNETRCDNTSYCTAKSQCPAEAIIYDEEIEKIIVDAGKCLGCGKCLKFCPNEALKIVEF